MGKAIREEEDVRMMLHWLKELTGVTSVEDAIVLGFHRVDATDEWNKEQQKLTEIRDLYLLKLDGRTAVDVAALYVVA